VKHEAEGPIDAATVRRVAYETDTDVRSVWKQLAGVRVRGRSGERIRHALAELRGQATTPKP
jgi:hypothetical protein